MRFLKSLALPKLPKPYYLRRISGTSMMPTYQPGDIVLVQKQNSRIIVSDVVVFEHQNIEMIKRVTLTKGTELWLEGDNKLRSSGSHQFGYISRTHIKGKVVFLLKRRTIRQLFGR